MPENNSDLMKILDEHLAVTDQDGHVVLQVALLATVYLQEPYTRETRDAVVSCCEDYLKRCGQHLRWAWNPDTEFMSPFGKGKGSEPRTWIPALCEDQTYSVICHGAEYDRGASAFSMEALGPQRRPYEDLGFFRVSFPLLWFTENPGSLPEVLLEICSKLRPVSGYGGIGVIESPDNAVSHWHEPIVYEWAQRFPGLEADYPIPHAICLSMGRGGKGGIKGVNWLTVVGDRWLAEMGGADKVAADLAALDSQFIVHRFAGGVMIQAGAHPDLGIAERAIWPALYVKLARYLKPIRITDTYPFQHGGDGVRFDLQRSNAWLRRFDDR